MAKPGHGYRRMIIDGIAVSKPCVVYALVFTPRNLQHEVTVYDGLDTSSGEVLHKIVADVKETRTVNLGGGVYCANGVYVDFSSPPGDLLIIYDTVETI